MTKVFILIVLSVPVVLIGGIGVMSVPNQQFAGIIFSVGFVGIIFMALDSCLER